MICPETGGVDTSMLTTEELLDRLLTVRAAAVAAETDRAQEVEALPEGQREGAANLLHYLALRNVDLRDEQRALAARGLSSLGRAEAHVLATLDAVIARLGADVAVDPAAGSPVMPDDLGRRGPSAVTGHDRLRRHAIEALGPAPSGRSTRVMVTMPSEAASDPALVQSFVSAGMTIARINGAHDDPAAWRAMAEHVRRADREHGQAVRIAFDLAGPKLRTGPIAPGPAVVRVRPARDPRGRVVSPARFALVSAAGTSVGTSVGDELTSIPVDHLLIAGAACGDEIRFEDARGRKRSLTVTDVNGSALEVVCDRTAYFVAGLELVRRRGGEAQATGRVGALPATASSIDLRVGDLLELRAGRQPGRSARVGADQIVIEPAHVGVDVPELFGALAVGHRVLLDDGAIETVVRSLDADRIVVEVVRPDRAKLRAEKGINVPDVSVPIAALTDADLAALETAVSFADLIAFSFVSGPDDIGRLHDELDRLGACDVGVILKIEHRAAFEYLPDMLIAAMRRPPAAVMVARGDLAVEVGYERLAEVQEEILWLCEAAHVPVIWATQVLESLAKRGAPTRAEVTDAAWSSRAECVMLNKGPYIAETIRFLDDILGRMDAHQSKRTPLLRRLSVATAPYVSD
jgi:pyruvate kinase